MENVAVVGASEKTDRYSNKAMQMLAEHGHNPIPVAPTKKTILERTAYPNLADVPDELDTVTLYLGAGRQAPVLEAVMSRRPRRVIFNPGAENPDAYDQLKSAGIEVVEACTSGDAQKRPILIMSRGLPPALMFSCLHRCFKTPILTRQKIKHISRLVTKGTLCTSTTNLKPRCNPKSKCISWGDKASASDARPYPPKRPSETRNTMITRSSRVKKRWSRRIFGAQKVRHSPTLLKTPIAG